MTSEEESAEDASPADRDDGPGAGDAPRSVRPGASTFTIEGRAAPGLFVVGWLASLLGLSIVFVGALGGSTLLLYVVGPALLSLGLVAGGGNQALERRARGEPYAGPSPFVVFAAIVAVSYFIGAILGIVLEVLFAAVEVDLGGPPGQLLGGLLTAVVFVGLVRLLVVGTGALTWREMGLRPFDGAAVRDLLHGAAWALPVIFVTGLVAAVLVEIFKVVSPSPLPPTGQLGGLVVQLVAGAIVAPVAEEIVFRGFAVTAWRRTIGAQRAVVRAALLFALAHVVAIQASSFGEAVGLIAVGMGTRLPVAYALGRLFVAKGSLWAPIGLHATFNGVLLVIAHVALTSGAA